MFYSISSFLSYETWSLIGICSSAIAIQALFVKIIEMKRWMVTLCACITIFSSICEIQIYSIAKELAYPMNFFDSYNDIQSYENFKYKITVYDEKDSKQVRVHDNENSLTFDFIVKNNNEATTEYIKYLFEN